MRTIQTTIVVDEDHRATIPLPEDITPGTHEVVLVIQERGAERKTLEFPVIDVGKWPDDLSLRREDMYDDWGR
jgi:hypothetical protein